MPSVMPLYVAALAPIPGRVYISPSQLPLSGNVQADRYRARFTGRWMSVTQLGPYDPYD